MGDGMPDVKTDVLVIGSGVAGLMFALKAAEFATVALVTKKEAMDSNTNLAQGGIASVFEKTDSFDLHIQDTLVAGDGLCNRDVVEMVVKDGPRRIQELMALGVQFNTQSAQPRRKRATPRLTWDVKAATRTTASCTPRT